MNLFSLAKAFPTEDAALDYWINIRWPNGVVCVECGHKKVYRIDTQNKSGKPCRLFECADCKLHFSPTSGTLFHDSHLPLQKWFAAIALMCEAKKGISAHQMKRHIGVTYKTAWYLCHRIRKAMQEDSDFKIGGPTSTVEIDEMYVGGSMRRRGSKSQYSNKTAVVGLAERNGKLHMEVMDSVNLLAMREHVAERLEPATSLVVTDGKTLYKGVIPRKQHSRVIHNEELKVKNWTSTYTVEGAFSLFKRGIVGNYHRLGTEHLNAYLSEFCWRFNRRRQQPAMFGMVLRNLSEKKPMPYKMLTNKIC